MCHLYTSIGLRLENENGNLIVWEKSGNQIRTALTHIQSTNIQSYKLQKLKDEIIKTGSNFNKIGNKIPWYTALKYIIKVYTLQDWRLLGRGEKDPGIT